jgi:hypothetical protein
MLHPLFSTLIQRPDLVADHVAAYAALLGQEASTAGTEIVSKIVAWVVALLCMVIFLGLAGTAVMLGILQNQFHPVLVIVPGVALLLGVIALFWAKKPLKSDHFPELKAQIASDTRALRMAA